MDPASPVLWFAIRAIAAGAAGRPLAVWAVEEAEAERVRAQEQQVELHKMLWEQPE